MKKRIMLLVVVLAVTVTAEAKKTDRREIPGNVEQAFSQKYQGVAVKKWNKENGEETAKFLQGHKKEFAVFSNDGSWLRTETKMQWSWDLPRAVDKAWQNGAYGAWKPDEIRSVESAGKGNYYTITVSYDFGPDGSIPGDWTKSYKLYYDASGNMFRKDLLD